MVLELCTFRMHNLKLCHCIRGSLIPCNSQVASMSISFIERLPRRFFPSNVVYRELLVAEGFQVERCELVYRPTLLPTDVMGWLETFCTSFLELVPVEQRQMVCNTTRD